MRKKPTVFWHMRNAEFRQQMRRHFCQILITIAKRTSARPQETRNDPEKSGLARAIGAKQAHRFPRLYPQPHPEQRLKIAVTGLDA